MTRPATPLAPVNVTRRLPNLRTGKNETWAAETTDGVWRIARIEASGTPWELVHIPSGLAAGLHGSLRRARQAIATGAAARQMDYDANWARSQAEQASTPERAEQHRRRAAALDAAYLSLVAAA